MTITQKKFQKKRKSCFKCVIFSKYPKVLIILTGSGVLVNQTFYYLHSQNELYILHNTVTKHTQKNPPVNENDDQHTKDNEKSHCSNPYLSLQRKCRLTEGIILHFAQRKIKIPHLYLQPQQTHFSEALSTSMSV